MGLKKIFRLISSAKTRPAGDALASSECICVSSCKTNLGLHDTKNNYLSVQ